MPKQPVKKVAGPITNIRDLRIDPKNARKRTDRGRAMLTDSLQKFGAARSIVIDEDGRILAGNGTVEAAAAAGIENVQVVEADGKTLIAVRRTGMTKSEKTLYSLGDNRTAELAVWNAEELAKLVSDGVDMSHLFRDDEIDELGEEGAFWDGKESGEAVGEGGTDFSGDPEKRKMAVRPVIYADQISVIERALAATGERTRGDALVVLCWSFLHEKG